MEYLIVRANPKLLKPKGNTSVLINGERNGFVNKVIILEAGFVQVSVDNPKAAKKVVELKNTTIQQPMEVTIQ